MQTVTEIIFGVFAALIGTLAALCIPIQAKTYLLWKKPITIVDMICELCGISQELTIIMIGLSFGLISYTGFVLYRKILK